MEKMEKHRRTKRTVMKFASAEKLPCNKKHERKIQTETYGRVTGRSSQGCGCPCVFLCGYLHGLARQNQAQRHAFSYLTGINYHVSAEFMGSVQNNSYSFSALHVTRHSK